MAGNRISFIASLGIARAKDACRTAGTLCIALLPKGQDRCRGHLAPDRSTPVDRDSAVCEKGLGAARALL